MHRALIAGACLTPDHKVLTADLRYVPLGDVCAGDKLVSFDETVEESSGRSRRYKTGTVEAVKRDVEEVFLVTLRSGKQFKVTADHLWMTRAFGQQLVGGQSTYQWRTTDTLRKGTIIPRLLDEWEPANDYGLGYLAGMFDGEGCYYTRKKGGHMTAQLSISQRENVALRKTMIELARLGFSVTHKQTAAQTTM
jgi:intein/homing endonuclease